MISISCAIVSCTCGRWTFTATSSPVMRRALWTWAIEAEPKGTSSIASKMSSIGIVYSDLRAERTASLSIGSTLALSFVSSWQNGSGRISERIERICPAFTKVGPSSSSIFLSVTGVRPCRISYLRTTARISPMRFLREARVPLSYPPWRPPRSPIVSSKAASFMPS